MISKPRPKALDRLDRKRAESATYRTARAKALARDKGMCRVCGASYGLETHHVVPRSHHGIKQVAAKHAVENLICVCKTCHGFITGNILKLVCLTPKGASGKVRVDKYDDSTGGYVTFREAV